MQLKLSMSNENPLINFRFLVGVDVGVLYQKLAFYINTLYVKPTHSAAEAVQDQQSFVWKF